MSLAAILTSVVPSIAVLGLFWFVMRGIIRADRREREALARLDAEEAAAARHDAQEGGPDASAPSGAQ